MHAIAARHTLRVSAIALGICLAFSAGQRGVWAETAGDDQRPANQVVRTHSLVGSYLAGRLAKKLNDQESAAIFYRNALARDPGNGVLLEQALLLELSSGRYEPAIELSEKLVAIEPSHRIGHLLLGLESFKKKSFPEAEKHFNAAATNPLGQLTAAIASGWVKVAEGDVRGATRLADAARQADWAKNYVRFQRALMTEIGGKLNEALSAYRGVFAQDSKALRPTMAYVVHVARSGNIAKARAIMAEYLSKVKGDPHPMAIELNDRLKKSGSEFELLVKTPAEGLAEVFYGLGEALASEGGVALGVAYLQMALFVKPDHQLALVALAGAEESKKRYEAAIDTYDRIPATSPLAQAVGIRKAFNLNSLDKVDEARTTLLALLEAKMENGDEPETTPMPMPASAPEAQADGDASGLEEIDDADLTSVEVPSPEAPLKLGDSDDRVMMLQEALAQLGYDVGAPDGAFGERTRDAVLQFQRNKQLQADGLVGPETFGMILGIEPETDDQFAEAGPAVEEPVVEQATPKISRNDALKLQVLDALGSIMRARKHYKEAAGYYDQAIAMIPQPPTRRHWAYFYARGTCHERLKDWPAAEKDLKQALALVPEQPLVLNYLGYSWIDQGINLAEGMELIEKAVALKPDDGYIVDSLGWAHFKQGNFTDAVNYLERAVELKPADPVLNDHLGDALWRVGREREARFQWDQSLSLKPEPDDAANTRKKIKHGLSALPPRAEEVPKTSQKTSERSRRSEADTGGPQSRRVQ